MRSHIPRLLLLFTHSLLFAACSSAPKAEVDVTPIGNGLTFLGLAVVLAALVLVFGRFLR